MRVTLPSRARPMTPHPRAWAIVPVRSKRDLDRFVDLPWSIYPRSSPWVPPLKSEVREMLDVTRFPLWENAERELFLAVDGDRVLGRIAAIDHRGHTRVYNDGAGFFGFFECVEDAAVALELFRAAEQWLAARGLTTMRGPVSPSFNDEIGLLLDDFAGRPAILMPYTPEYYAGLFALAGLVKVRELYSYLATKHNSPSERQLRLAEGMKHRHHVTIRNIRLKDAKREAAVIMGIYNEAWIDLWGHVPMTEREAQYMTGKLKQFADEKLILVANVDGEPAAFALAVPDMNEVLARINGRLTPLAIAKVLWHRRKIKGSRLLALGVHKEHRRKGIEALLVIELFRRGIAGGYESMDVGWVLEDNAPSNNVLKNLGFPLYRRYGIFERPIPAAVRP